MTHAANAERAERQTRAHAAMKRIAAALGLPRRAVYCPPEDIHTGLEDRTFFPVTLEALEQIAAIIAPENDS